VVCSRPQCVCSYSAAVLQSTCYPAAVLQLLCRCLCYLGGLQLCRSCSAAVLQLSAPVLQLMRLCLWFSCRVAPQQLGTAAFLQLDCFPASGPAAIVLLDCGWPAAGLSAASGPTLKGLPACLSGCRHPGSPHQALGPTVLHPAAAKPAARRGGGAGHPAEVHQPAGQHQPGACSRQPLKCRADHHRRRAAGECRRGGLCLVQFLTQCIASA
jgi:hypothetical protein